MTIKALYPTVRPTLNLDFAKTKALDPRVTFTRASTATFVGANGLIQTAASGAPRFDHNPATGESLGLLVEEARTNSQLYSEQFDNNTTWSKFNSSVTANAVIAPDGTLTADKLINDSSTNAHLAAGINVSVASLGAGGTFSCFMKAAELTRAALGYDDVYVVFNLSTGAVFSTTNVPGFTVTSSIQSFPNGWYRCSITVNTGGAAFNRRTSVWTANNSGNISYAGDGASGVYTWGAQFEQGLFPTSYIPTTTATVTRAADVASMTGTNFSSWYNANTSTILSEARSSNGGDPLSWVYSFGDYGNGILFYRQNNTAVVDIRTANASQYFQSSAVGTWTGSLVNKLALAVSTSSGKQASNGLLGNEDTSILIPSVSSMSIGSLGGIADWFNGTIARLAYYPVRLPDAQLQALTAT